MNQTITHTEARTRNPLIARQEASVSGIQAKNIRLILKF